MKIIKRTLACALLAALALAPAANALDIAPILAPITAPARLPDNILVCGTVSEIGENYLRIVNIDENADFADIIAHIGEQTRVIDAVEALPYNLENLAVGDYVMAYVNSFMTMSMPPQTGAQLILCNIPQDYIAPTYHTVRQSELSADGLSVSFTTDKDESFTFGDDVALSPYLTRNMVYPANIVPGAKMLVWQSAARGQQAPEPVKAVLFPYEYNGYLEIKDNAIYLSGQPVDVGAASVIEGEYSLLLPLRALCEAAGWKVEWSAAARNATLTQGGDTLVVTPGADTALSGESEIIMQVQPEIVNGFTMMSVWDISRLLNLYY